MIKFNKAYLAISNDAKEQAKQISNIRNTWIANQKRLGAMAGGDSMAINQGIATEDFFRKTDKAIVAARTQAKYKFVEDLAGLATPVPVGALSYASLASGDISDTISRSMDMQGLKTFDSITAGSDKNPIPAFTGGVGMNYRYRMGLQEESIDLMTQGITRKTIKIMENIGDYFLNGDSNIVADGVAGQGIKNHRNTRLITLANSLVTGTSDQIITFFQQTFKAILNEEVVDKVKVWVSPEIMINLMKPLSAAGEYKEGTLLDQVKRFCPHIESIDEDFALNGDEFIAYMRDKQVISPLIALPITSYQAMRIDPYENFNTNIIAVQGLKIASTYNGKKGVFYAHKA